MNKEKQRKGDTKQSQWEWDRGGGCGLCVYVCAVRESVYVWVFGELT